MEGARGNAAILDRTFTSCPFHYPLLFRCGLSSISNHFYRTFAYTNVFVGCMMISPQFVDVAVLLLLMFGFIFRGKILLEETVGKHVLNERDRQKRCFAPFLPAPSIKTFSSCPFHPPLTSKYKYPQLFLFIICLPPQTVKRGRHLFHYPMEFVRYPIGFL
jgi:hypothetical protein